MRKLLLIILLLPTIALAQKFPQTYFSTAPTGSTAVTLTYRQGASTADSLNALYVFMNGKYNRVFTATGVINYLITYIPYLSNSNAFTSQNTFTNSSTPAIQLLNGSSIGFVNGSYQSKIAENGDQLSFLSSSGDQSRLHSDGKLYYYNGGSQIQYLLSGQTDTITGKYPYINKKLGVAGDSYMAYNIEQPYLQSTLGLSSVTTNAQPGSFLIPGYEYLRGGGRLRSIAEAIYLFFRPANSANYPDLFVFDGGQNDQGYNLPIGSPGDMITPTFSGDTIVASSVVGATFYGTLNWAFKYMATNSPNTKIVYQTIVPTDSGSQGYPVAYNQQLQYVDAAIFAGGPYGAIVSDLYRGSGINWYNIGTFLQSDKTHPNTPGWALINNKLTADILRSAGTVGINVNQNANGDISLPANFSVTGSTKLNQQLEVVKSGLYSNESQFGAEFHTTSGNPKLYMGVDNTNGIGFIDAIQEATSSTTVPLAIKPNGGKTLIGGHADAGTNSTIQLIGAPFISGGATITTPVQGTYINWNDGLAGGTSFFNQKGGGTGGFGFYESTTGSVKTLLATITNSGVTSINLNNIRPDSDFSHASPPTSTSTGKRGDVWYDTVSKDKYEWVADNVVARYLHDPSF